MVRDPEGNEVRIEAGCAFELGPGADAWVAGDVPCVALDFIPLATDQFEVRAGQHVPRGE